MPLLLLAFFGSRGKYTPGLSPRLNGSKMPGGFGLTAIKSYLVTTSLAIAIQSRDKGRDHRKI
jgi:hypothetical protein